MADKFSQPSFERVGTPGSKVRPKVLLIDDSSTIRGVLRQIIHGYQVDILEAEDGEQGYSHIVANLDIQLIFCDINMPGLDGLSLLDRLKSEEKRFGHIPIIMLTTESSKDMVIRAKDAGIKGWIIKPPIPARVIQCLETFVLNKKKAK